MKKKYTVWQNTKDSTLEKIYVKKQNEAPERPRER